MGRKWVVQCRNSRFEEQKSHKRALAMWKSSRRRKKKP